MPEYNPAHDERACRHALLRAAKHHSTDQISKATYRETRWTEEPSADVVADRLGGAWNTAVEKAGLTPNTRSGGRAQYSDAALKSAVKRASAATAGHRLSMSAYREWRASQPDPSECPSPFTISEQVGDGSWPAAVEAAGRLAGRPGGPRGDEHGTYSPRECRAAVRRVIDDLGHCPSQARYDRERGSDDPAHETVIVYLGPWSDIRESLGDG